MKLVASEVERTIRDLGVSARRVDARQGDLIRSRVEDRYSPGSRRWPIWETSRFRESVHDAQGWQWIGDYVGANPCYMMFNPDDAVDVFLFESGAAIKDVLADTFGFEFYVTDEEASFLFCFNHHDMLLADGSAAEWLARHHAAP